MKWSGLPRFLHDQPTLLANSNSDRSIQTVMKNRDLSEKNARLGELTRVMIF